MYKKHYWTPYGRKATFLDLKVKDQTEQVIDAVRLEKGKENEIANERKLRKLKRYGFNLVQREGEKENKPEEEMAEEKKKDVDWLRKDIEW